MKNNDLDQISQLLDQKLKPIHLELQEHGRILNQHGKVLQQHGKVLQQHGKVLQQHGKILKSLKKDQSAILNALDNEQMKQRKRLKRVEEQLSLPPTA